MKALLIVAHGSRRETSNDEVRQITLQVAEIGVARDRNPGVKISQAPYLGSADGVGRLLLGLARGVG